MVEYNIWVMHRLRDALTDLSDDDFNRDVGLYFKSILGTLNHVLLGEHYLWYPRFVEGVSPNLQLTDIIEPDPQVCLAQLVKKSQGWIPFIQKLDESRLNEYICYQRANGESLCLDFSATLMHVFNHATHHRGQISAAMTMLGYSCPELDLVYLLAEKQKTKSNL